jgi:integrase
MEEVLKWAIAREDSQRLNPASMDGHLGTLLTGRQRPSKPLAALPYQLIPALMAEFDFTPRTFFTVGEAARACDLAYASIYRAIMDCRLPATKAEVPVYRGAFQEWHIDPTDLFNIWPKKVDLIPGLPPVAFALIRFSIMTGQRPGETASMRWSEWQGGQQLWVLPWQRTKEGRKILQDQVIPLSPPCVKILTALRAQQQRDRVVTDFVFGNYITANMTSKIIGKPPCTHTILFHLRRKLPPEWQHATMHGMRTSLRSWGDDQLKPDGVTRRFAEKDLERAIGHIAGFGATPVSRLYSRDSIEIRPLIPIFNSYAAFCLRPPADIVPFRKQAKQGA